MKIDKQYRQGDVLITPAAIPSKAKRAVLEEIVLAEGEATGHRHVIRNPQNRVTPYHHEGQLYLRVKSAVEVEHEEHGAATLEPGDYVVARQTEDWLGEVRRVAD